MTTANNQNAMRIVVSVMLIGLLAGCATGQQAASSATRANSGPIGPSASSSNSIPYSRITSRIVPLHVSRTAPTGTISATWAMRPIADLASSNRVYLFVDVPVCSGGGMAFTMTMTSRAVEIGYWVRPAPEHVMCSAMRVTTDGYIQLPGAIGNRAITHVPSGQHAPG